MNILHLTDFHFRATQKFAFDQETFVNALCESLKKGPKIDFLFFTGDLVNAGTNQEDFSSAKELLIDGIKKATGITDAQIFICAGNHDVHRLQEMPAINLKFDTIKENSDLDSFVHHSNEREFKESLQNHGNFLEFQKEFYSGVPEDEVHSLYSVHLREFKGKKIGIATINSAWRSSKSNTDRGNLFYPLTFLKHCITKVKDCDLKILLLHHPLSDFKDWNSSELEDLIFHNFHLMFSGHVHKKRQSMQITTDEGIFCCVSPATLSLFENTAQVKHGHTILTIDIDTLKIDIANFIYDKQDNQFLSIKPLSVYIPLNEIKTEQNEFRRTLRKRFKESLDNANDAFIGVNEDKSIHSGFLEMFSNPILKNKSRAELQSKTIEAQKFHVEQLISDKNSYLIFGKDKSGRTSLLYKIKLDLLKDFSNHKTIPFYIDCKDFRSEKPFDLFTLLSRFYEVNKNKLGDILTQYHLKLLIDNYDPGIKTFNTSLTSFLENNPNVSFIACAEETISRSYETLRIGPSQHLYLFIHEISRSEVRELTNKWPDLSDEKRENILEKIGEIFYQLNIPLNYWTVSLFIWVYEKNADANFHNNVDLIQLYVDGILERNKLSFDKDSKINFDDFKIFISELAYFLITEHGTDGYSADYTQIINFTHSYREKNKKFVIEVDEIVELLLDKGILKKKISDSRYTFRLNGVFEYFLAFYMKDNLDFRNSAINDNHYYLSFGNELELCAGFNRRDESLLQDIFVKTQHIYKNTNLRFQQTGSTDENLKQQIKNTFDIAGPLLNLKKGFKKLALSPEKQDSLTEQFSPVEIQRAEVERKKYYENIEINPENLEKALFILARVFRNTTLRNDKLNTEVLDFVLDSACNLGFTLIEDSKSTDLKFLTEREDEEMLMVLVTNFIPLIVQTFLFDALAQNNLERIILEKIELLKKAPKQNQFKLLLLYFLLIDLNVKQNKNYIDELISLTYLPILKQTILIKLYFYLMFKSFNSPVFQNFLAERIESLTLKLNPKADKSDLNKRLAKSKIQGNSEKLL